MMEAEYWAGDNPCERGEIEKFGRFVKWRICQIKKTDHKLSYQIMEIFKLKETKKKEKKNKRKKYSYKLKIKQ